MYLIVRDSDAVVVGAYRADPGSAPANHTKYNETPNIGIRGWSGSNIITRTGVDTYTSSALPFQDKSFDINISDNVTFWITRDATAFDWSTPYTVIIPIKADWLTGLGAAGYIMDANGPFYMQVTSTVLQIRAFDAGGNSYSNTAMTHTDGITRYLGLTYDGAGGWQFILDGDLKTNSNTRNPVATSSGLTRFGERGGYAVDTDMEYGNVLVLNKVISAQELTDYHNGGSPKNARDVFPESDILHYYCADNMQGNVVVDDGGIPDDRRGSVAEAGLQTMTSTF